MAIKSLYANDVPVITYENIHGYHATNVDLLHRQGKVYPLRGTLLHGV